jgi:S-adenosylmethionine decarboxylase
MHLVIDGYDGDAAKLQDHDLVHRFLDSYPSVIGMTKLMPPHVLTYDGPKREDWGISGFVIIAESHISIHTFPERQYINIDIFSCKDFDTIKALEDVKMAFSLEKVSTWTIDRGLEHLSPQAAVIAMNSDRRKLVSG